MPGTHERATKRKVADPSQPHVGGGALLPDRPVADVAVDHRPAGPAALAHDRSLGRAASRSGCRHPGAQRVAGVTRGIETGQLTRPLDDAGHGPGVESLAPEMAVTVDLPPQRAVGDEEIVRICFRTAEVLSYLKDE